MRLRHRHRSSTPRALLLSLAAVALAALASGADGADDGDGAMTTSAVGSEPDADDLGFAASDGGSAEVDLSASAADAADDADDAGDASAFDASSTVEVPEVATAAAPADGATGEDPRGADAARATSTDGYAKPLVKRKAPRVAKPGQEPGRCTACKAVAHRLQSVLHAAYLAHTSNDPAAILSMAESREKLPGDAYAAAMQGVCEDNKHWNEYKSYTLDDGGSVLAGPGLEWSPGDHPEDALENKSHVGEIGTYCRDFMMEDGAEDRLYGEFWDGITKPGARKWFLQETMCKQTGQACHIARDEL